MLERNGRFSPSALFSTESTSVQLQYLAGVRRTVNIRNQKITIILFNLSLFLLSIFSSKRQLMRLSPSLGPHQNCVIVVSWASAVLRAYQPNCDISSHGSYSFHFYELRFRYEGLLAHRLTRSMNFNGGFHNRVYSVFCLICLNMEMTR